MTILIGLAAFYVLVVGGLFVAQTSMLFPSGMAAHGRLPVPEAAERISLETGDGETIQGLLIRRGEGPRPLIIGFGGNAWNGDDVAIYLSGLLPTLDVAAFHYRGYGPSTGSPGEAALLADSVTVFDGLTERLGDPPVIAAGFSIGAAVAAHLSKERPLAGLVLITPPDSIEAVAKEHYFWVPVGLLLRHKFRADEAMKGNPTPAAVIGAEHDEIIPPRRTEALKAVIGNLVLERTIPGAGHNDLYDHPAFAEAVAAAVRAIEEAARPSPESSG